jgi:hypothetical protein
MNESPGFETVEDMIEQAERYYQGLAGHWSLV